MSASRLQLVALDMVGTTVDGGEEVPLAFLEAFAQHGLTVTAQHVDAVRGRGKAEAVRALLPAQASDEVAAAIAATLMTLLRQQLVAQARPLPGAAETLRWLRERKIAVALGTGLDRFTATAMLRQCGWTTGYMDTLVTADDVQRGRPDPQWIQVAMFRLGVEDPRYVLVAGDTTADLQSAAAAGVGYSLGILSGAHDAERLATQPHTALLPSVAELPGWILAHDLT